MWKLSISAYRKITNKHTLCCREILAFFWRFFKHQSTLCCAVIAMLWHKIIFKLLFLKPNILDWRQINWYNNFYLLPPRYGLVEIWSFPDSHKMSASPKWSYMYYHWLSLILFTPESLRCMKILLSFSITSYLQIYRHQRVKTPLSKLPLFLLQNMKNRIAQPWNNTDKQSKKSLDEITVTKI